MSTRVETGIGFDTTALPSLTIHSVPGLFATFWANHRRLLESSNRPHPRTSARRLNLRSSPATLTNPWSSPATARPFRVKPAKFTMPLPPLFLGSVIVADCSKDRSARSTGLGGQEVTS